MNNETNLEQIENKLKTVCDELRKSAEGSYAEKTAKRLEDHEATGERDGLDIKDAIQCLRDDDQYIRATADRIEAALDDPATVFAILRDFHNAHYSVFPRDELTERLCHAFYDQFVEKPEVKEPAAATIQIDAFAFPDGAKIDGVDDDEPNPRRPFLVPDPRYKARKEWRWQPTIDVENGVIVGWPKGVVAEIYDKPADDCAVLLNGRNLNDGEYVPAFLRPGHNDDDYIVMNIDGEGKIAGWDATEAKAWIAKALIEAEGGAK